MKVQFSLAEEASVRFEIINMLGQHISDIKSDGPLSSGKHEMAWDGHRDEMGSDPAAGTYLIRMVTTDVNGTNTVQKSAGRFILIY